jgi:hypothetical protein
MIIKNFKMKKIKAIILFSVLVFAFASCREEEAPTSASELVRFRLDVSTDSDDLALASSAWLNISTPSGPVSKEVTITQSAEGYFTEAIQLPAGRNTLNGFLVLGANGSVISASPKNGSLKATAVENSLPFDFNVGQNSEPVNVQMVMVTNEPASAFGYATFDIDVVQPLAISVFIEQEGKLVLTNANAVIRRADASTVHESDLGAKVNYIQFTGEASEVHELVVSKSGYRSLLVEFTYDELNASHAITVVLEKATPILRFPVTYGMQAQLVVGPASDKDIYIHWGDGHVDTVNSHTDEWFIHTYAFGNDPRVAEVSLSGAIETISFLTVLSTENVSADLSSLPNLAGFNMDLSTMDVLDLRLNFKLRRIDIMNSVVNDILLNDDKPLLKAFAVSGAPAQTVDEIVSEVYTNTVANNIREGNYLEWNDAPASEASTAKMRSLALDYGWKGVPWFE